MEKIENVKLSEKLKKVKKYTQIIYSEKRKKFIENYLSPKGQRLVKEGKLTKEEATKKYGKNRYRVNLNAKPVKTINH